MRDLSGTTGLLSLNTATLGPKRTLKDAVEGCLRHGIEGISPWRDKIAEIGLTEAERMIRRSGLTVTGVCRGGMFPAADAEGRRLALEDNRRAIDEAAALGAACLVLVVGGLPAGSKDLKGARRQVEDGLAASLDYARSAGVSLAIEPLHPMYAADRACVNTLGQALDLCDRLGSGIGVAVDVYHVWWDPELDGQIARAGRQDRLLAYHVCDWMVPTADLLLDRGMMGDGVIDLPGIRRSMEEAGYAGLCEVEIFSANNWWPKSIDEILAVMVERGKLL
ncbi:sugar phosphate isomerase/epimerase family protein [Telmatospirillum sp.]|uniref:sugar phosphate isomerase/epimerase family protein n=1 Tax=Telmatospirillum sp. TaxID=2079197 RepID=UPI00283D180F|nr:sugar phosphate isomerase/epimerase family protein [Telmatospirillum sp.]MDR3437484.1 sugar phosphate isomerase/epimerase [Telmatospirillum sp.]